jgi:hypothetical protein
LVKNLELSKKTPVDWYGAWRNQLYEFDILRELSNDGENNYLILDSDILIRESLIPLFQEIEKNGAICYDCGYEVNHNINGISIAEMRSLYTDIYGEGEGLPSYYGGEFIGLTSRVIKKLVDEFEFLWSENYKRYENKIFKLNEEAHFLSVLYYKLDVCNDLGNKYIRRMWTAIKYDNINEKDVYLSIWHLPAEKKYGLNKLFEWFKINKNCSKKDYLTISDKIMVISGSKIRRFLIKFADKVKEKFC